MNYGSVCSGIEAATVAWEPLGFKPQWFCQYDPEHNYKKGPDFPSKVLRHHYPDVPNLGDMTKLRDNKIFNERTIDILVGGTPCQSFSIAGLRKGMADERGQLTIQFIKTADRKRPRWLVWENTPGVLSSNGGKDFASFIGGLAECGYGFAYRILDAQYFGLAQRRKRVFVVGYYGDWRRAGAVLFERTSMSGHPKPCKKARKEIAEGVNNGIATLWNGSEIAGTLTKSNADGSQRMPDKGNFNAVLTFKDRAGKLGGGKGILINKNISFPVDASTKILSLSFNDVNGKRKDRPNGGLYITEPEVSQSLTTNESPIKIVSKNFIRRLTPIECERLQGFPDNYTNIPGAKDTWRYKAIGNSMPVPVMKWIGERIKMVDAL